jgi:putative transposase
MPITVYINPGDLYHVTGKGLYIFEKEEGHNVLVFRRQGTRYELRMPEHEFYERLDKNQIEKVEVDKNGVPVVRQEVGPGEVWTITKDPEDAKLTPEGKRALALQYVTIKWDQDDKATLGGVGLQALINRCRPYLISEKLEPFAMSEDDTRSRKKGLRVEVATLYRAIKNCGVKGHRPLAAFLSGQGQGPRKRYPRVVEHLLDRTVSFFWELRSRDYDDAYAFFFTELKKINAERLRKKLPEIKKFPRKTEVIRRRIQKNKCYVRWGTKHGPKNARKKFKGQGDHISAKWPLELCIIDSTPLDDYLVHKIHVVDTETCLPLGRPWLTVCLDVATRMPLGFLVSFEPPSVYSALTTLKRVIKTKRYMTKLYPHITRVWDGFGVPVELLMDNTWEHKSPSLKHSLRNVGIELHWAPVRSAEYKSIKERFFHTINTGLIHKLPGGVPYHPYLMKQVGLDPMKDAVVSLDDINAFIHEFIVNYIYDKHTGLGAVPGRVWHDKLMMNRRRVIRTDSLDHILGRVETAVLAPSGITFKNMEFHDREAVSSLLEDLVKETKIRSQSPRENAPSRVKVLITWNPADAGSITVWNDLARTYVTLPNRDQKFFKGISFWHAEKIREHCERLDLDFSSEADRWTARDDLRRRYEKIMRKKPMRQSRDARRGLAFSQGNFDEIVEDTADDITADDILDLVAEPSTTGMSEPEEVPDELAYKMLKDNARPKGRTPSQKSIEKGKRTRATNEQEKQDAEHAAAVKRQRGDPTGNPQARGIKVNIKPATGPGWGNEKASAETATPKSGGLFTAKGPGWGDSGRQE